MADDYKKQVADFYRTENALPLDASDDDIIDFAKSDNPDGFQAVTEEVYGHQKPEPQPEHPLVSAAIQAASDTADEVNRKTEEQASRHLSDATGIADGIGIAANKGLSAATGASKTIGSGFDAVAENIDRLNNKLPTGLKQLSQLATAPTKQLVELSASMFPRTPMQSVFSAITAPISDIKKSGAGLTEFLGRMVGTESSVAAKTAMGAINSPAVRYPESKLAASIENILEGTNGKDEFKLKNASAINEETQAIGKDQIPLAENAVGAKEEGYIAEREGHDLANSVADEHGKLNRIGSDRAAEKLSIEGKIAEQKQIITNKEGAANSLSQGGQDLAVLRRAKVASIKADLAVDEALGMATKTPRGIHASRGVVGAVIKARKEVSIVNEFATHIGSTVELDFKPIVNKFEDKFNELGYQLALLPEDFRAIRVLDKLKGHTEYLSKLRPVTAAQKELRLGFLAGASKELAAAAPALLDETKPTSATMSDAIKMYRDLNKLSRTKGEPIYLETRDIIGEFIRTAAEKGEGVVVSGKGSLEDAQITGKLWDRARQARMHLDVVSQNDTISQVMALTGKNAKGDPSQILSKLIGKDAEMPLQDFMRIAPKDAQAIVRRESLRNGLASVIGSEKGGATKALEGWIGATGSGNFKTLHSGADEAALRSIATSNDLLNSISKEYPVLRKQIGETFASVRDLMAEDVKSAIKAGDETASVKDKAFSAWNKISDKARAETLSRRELTKNRIASSIDSLEKAFEVRTKPSTRAGELGQVITSMTRKDDKYSSAAIATGAVGLAGGMAAEAVGLKTPGYVKGTAATLIALGIAKKSPQAFSSMYYSPAGRALMEKIASAPTSKEAASALLELAKMAGPTGTRLGIMSNINKNQPETEKPKLSLGQLDHLRGRNRQEAALLNTPNETPDQLPAKQDSKDDGETYAWPVQ